MRKICALAFVFASFAAAVLAQATTPQKQSRPTPATNLTVEIRYRKDYATFLAGDRSMWFGRFERIAGWQQPAGMLPVRAVQVSSRVESETALQIAVSVRQGERYHDEVKQVAAYTVRVDERVAVEELKQYGIVPIELRVVRTKPAAEAAPPYVESRTSALELVGVEPREATFPSYVVRLKNVSGKDIAALHVDYYTGKRHSSMRPQHPQNLPLIKAGAVYELNASGGGDGGELTADGYTPRALQKVVIATVVFADGTFEGEPLAAAEQHALQHARKLQITRALALIKDALEERGAGDETATVARFKAQVSALGEEVEPQVVGRLAAKFPSLGEQDRRMLSEGLRFYQHEIKMDLLRAVAKFEDARSTQQVTFRRWLESVQETYVQWLARL
ncbi:MAG TPA: hypothetical protein VK363_16490 [Pyrinomonadaceae bacterium]|nr:hypothetical protein [Pyrinomonadaceae bacterium]